MQYNAKLLTLFFVTSEWSDPLPRLCTKWLNDEALLLNGPKKPARNSN